MDIRRTLLVFLTLAPCFTLGFAPRTMSLAKRYPPTNSSSSPTAITSSCCFVVQDVVNATWWELYAPSVTYFNVTLTSITIYITPYINSTVTNIATNTYYSNQSSTTTVATGTNPVSLLLNNAPGPREVDTSLDSSFGSQFVTAGVTVHSPQAFFVYTTVKIVNVPAVTDSYGNVVCTTSSVLGYDTPSAYTSILSGINSNAEAYFGGYGIASITAENFDASHIATHSLTTVSDEVVTSISGTLTTSFSLIIVSSYTYEASIVSDLAINTAGSVVPFSTPYPGTLITFPTPYIYLPTQGAAGETKSTGDFFPAEWKTGPNEDFGYVPQTVIDYMKGVPAITSQYPGIASCLPGGPSIIYFDKASAAAPESQDAASELTSTTIITVNPYATTSNIPTATSPSTPINTALTDAVDTTSSTTTPSQDEPTSPTTPPSTSATPAAPSPPIDSPTQAQPTPSPTTPATPATPSDSPTPASPGNTTPETTTTAAAAALISTAAAPAGQPNIQTPGPALPLTGATTSLSGTPAIIISTPQTIPLIPGLSISGSTTVLGGTTSSVPASTTVIGGITSSVPGSVTVVGGTTTTFQGSQVVIGGTTTTEAGSVIVVGGTTSVVPGSQTVIGGTTAVVVSGVQTVVVPLSVLPVAGGGGGAATGTGTTTGTGAITGTGALTGGGAHSSGLAQVTSWAAKGARVGRGEWWGIAILFAWVVLR